MTTRTSSSPPAPARTNGKNGLVKRFNPLARTLHIYLTMLAMIAIMFFSSTGFMMNHDDWFPVPDTTGDPIQTTIPAALLKSTDRLPLVEHLRKTQHIRGEVNDSFELTDPEIDIVFSAPARKTDVKIIRDTGAATITVTSHGLVGLLTNLHKGTDTGPAWKRVIDTVAILLFTAALTGLVLFLALPKRRKIGLAALGLGLALPVLVYFLLLK